MALFPPGKGGGEDVAYGYKGKGILFHTLTDGNGMPLSCSTTPANGSEREQVMPLLDSIVVKSNRPGRPRKRVKVLAADKGYDSKDLRAALRKRGIRPQLPKRTWKTRKNRGRPIKISVPRFQQERCFAWFQQNTVGLLSDGREFLPVLMPLFPLQQFIFGLAEFYYWDKFVLRVRPLATENTPGAIL